LASSYSLDALSRVFLPLDTETPTQVAHHAQNDEGKFPLSLSEWWYFARVNKRPPSDVIVTPAT